MTGDMSARRRIVGVMGPSAASAAVLAAAERFGTLAAEAGWVVLTGGRPAGVMEAASRGAKRVPGSLTLGVLRGPPGSPVSEFVDLPIYTGMGDARNAVNVLSSEVVVACGVDGPGTASEVALALKSGRPTVLLAPTPAAEAFFRTLAGPPLLQVAATVEEAIAVVRARLGASGRR